ncbi:hypothetical protein ED733_003273 [Metarhizium rileyi]|uniref:C2H2-type domain-containing protein n=1 Tax=Metarhizium rileyi (strain RCEF 4871) TaxID=1649241 RepID=A0A5C6G645_METRR|nr:hypothetical protein ED733_003273 [Metarhizium rileyi]
MTPESDTGSPLSISPSIQACDPRVIIRQLLERYSKGDINRLVEEESCISSSVRGQLPELAFSVPPFCSDRDSMQSQMISSTQSGIVYHAYSSKLGRSLSSTHKSRRLSMNDRGTAVVSMAQRLDYACGFCAEENIRKTCTRRNDLRRHIENFHNSNAVWFCQHPGCKMAYDWQTAYQNHLRAEHGRSHMNVDEAKVKLCRQTVFACGFENCTQVFEAPNEDDTAATLKEYSGHIVKHFEEGSNGARWTYSTRVRNLLRQSQVSAFWEEAWPEMERPQLQWEPQSSMAVRKTLEACHLENLPLLIRSIIMLGSNPESLGQIEGKLEPPVRTRCPKAQYQQRLSYDGRPQSPRQPATEGDTLSQFRVSRGNGVEYGPYDNMQTGHHVPRSVEPFTVDGAMAQGRSHNQDQVQFSEGAVSLHPLPQPQLFYHGADSALYSQPSQMISTTMPPPQQHATGQYIAVGHETGPVVSPAGFPGVRHMSGIPSAMDIEMNSDGARVSNDRRGDWMANYTQMDINNSLPAERYEMDNPIKLEHDHMAGRYGSPTGSL